MTCYCTLHINSNDHAQLPPGMFLSKSLKSIEFTDNESPERRARRERMLAKGIPQRPHLPRYWWQLDSNGKAYGDDVYAHLVWILAQLKKGRLLSDLNPAGYQYWFSVFWEGNGTGGGPLIAQDTMGLLLQHKADLGLGFYLSS